jgi:hypothetical protein
LQCVKENCGNWNVNSFLMSWRRNADTCYRKSPLTAVALRGSAPTPNDSEGWTHFLCISLPSKFPTSSFSTWSTLFQDKLTKGVGEGGEEGKNFYFYI